MSQTASSDQHEVPTWTLGWRLKRALDFGDVSAQDMARELGVHPGTVSRWMNDRETPRPIYIRAWAFRTRVPLDWLIGGETMSSTGQLPTSPVAAPSNREQILAMRKHMRGGAMTQKAVER